VNNKLKNKFLAIIFVLLTPVIVLANSSENYQSTEIINYGGNFSSSENYQLVDNVGNSDVFWGQDPSSEPDITPQPKTTESPIKPLSSPTADYKEDLEIVSLQDQTIVERIAGFFNSIAENPFVQAIKTPLTVAVAALTLWASLVPMIMNLPMASPFANLFAWFLAIFKKKKKPWGRVYDSETGVGIPLVAVRLFDKDYNRLVKTEMTDNEGRFGFLVNSGKYYIKVLKKDFVFPSKVIHKDYHGQALEVKKEQAILVDIPLDSNIDKLSYKLNVLTKVTNFLEFFRIPLLVVGTFIAIAFMVTYFRVIDIIVLVVYILLWIWEIYALLSKSKTFGKVFDSETRESINLAIVRVFNSMSNKLVSTKVSDSSGRFRFLVDKGDYYLTSKKQNYKKFQSQPIIVVNKKVIVDDIKLELEKPTNRIMVSSEDSYKQKSEPTLLDIANA